MRRNIFYDKINRAYGNRENVLSNDLFRRHFKLFKTEKLLIEFQTLAKRKLSHSDVNTCVFFVKNETLKFVMERRN